jgi:FimV-like protein
MARTLLDEVATQGNDDQKREAAQLRERLLG